MKVPSKDNDAKLFAILPDRLQPLVQESRKRQRAKARREWASQNLNVTPTQQHGNGYPYPSN